MTTNYDANKMNMTTSSSKASSCQYASFNHANVMSLSTILVVLILMSIINIIPIIRSELMLIAIMIMCARKCEADRN